MQHFLYRIKRSVRSKEAIFWTLLFPLFLGLMFKFMFGNLGDVEMFSEVAVGIVEQEKNEIFVTMLKEIEMEEGTNMFDVTVYEDTENAEEALQNETIYAYILVNGNDFSLTIRQMDIYTSFVKAFVDQYKQNYTLIEDVARKHPEQVQNFVTNLYGDAGIGITQIDLKGQDKSPYTQYFYSLLAMSCLMASMFGMGTANALQADSGAIGARRNVAPTPKMKQFLVDMMADYCIYCILMVIVLGIIIFVYGQDFGENVGYVLLTTFVGSFNGLAAGFLIGTWVSGPRNKKDGLCVAFFMVSSFLGGLQMAELPYLIEQNCPIINRINPATLIVNAYKSIAVFGDVQQYIMNIVLLLVIGVVFMSLSIVKMRRTRYASL